MPKGNGAGYVKASKSGTKKAIKGATTGKGSTKKMSK